jgi:hypothetical protein
MSFPYSNGLPGQNIITPQTKNKNYNPAFTKFSNGARNRGNVIKANATTSNSGFIIIFVSNAPNSITFPYNYTSLDTRSGTLIGFINAQSIIPSLGVSNYFVPVDNYYRIVNFVGNTPNTIIASGNTYYQVPSQTNFSYFGVNITLYTPN